MSAFDQNPLENGQHPEFPHLYLFEIEPHFGSYILTVQGQDGSVLISADDAVEMFGDRLNDGFAYLVDDYLDYLE